MYEIKRPRTKLGIRGLPGSVLQSSLAPLGNFDIDVVRLLFTIALVLPLASLAVIKGSQRPSLAGRADFGPGGLLEET
jgi:hypothetical protein